MAVNTNGQIGQQQQGLQPQQQQALQERQMATRGTILYRPVPIEPYKCICDLHKVLMVTGCKCGGV